MYGCSASISPILAVFEQFLPRDAAVIDLGCGKGVWGHLLKTYFPGISVAGVEADPEAPSQFPGCIGKPWECSYTHVDREDLVPWLRRWPIPGATPPGPSPVATPYTVGLCLDVIEHLSRSDGEMLLDLTPAIAGHWLLATPSRLFDEGAPGYARHQSLWSKEDLRSRGFQPVHPRGADWPALGFAIILAYRGGWNLDLVPAIEIS
jgi:hypothetical protein